MTLALMKTPHVEVEIAMMCRKESSTQCQLNVAYRLHRDCECGAEQL